MTRDQMLKLSFKGYQTVIYRPSRTSEDFECLLLAIDFDYETVKLVPFDKIYEENEFWVSIQLVWPKMKIKGIKQTGSIN